MPAAVSRYCGNYSKRLVELARSFGVTCAKGVGMGKPLITVPSGITSSGTWSWPDPQHPERYADEHDPITLHRLRHTYATTKLRDGVSLPSVRKLLGHTNLQTTLRYTEIDLETIKRELVEARQRKR